MAYVKRSRAGGVKDGPSGAELRQREQLNLILSAIDSNNIEDWSSSCLKKVPFKIDNKKDLNDYFGSNALTLAIVSDDNQYSSSCWLTGSKCKDMNLRFNGLKSAPVVISLPSSVHIHDNKIDEVVALVNKHTTFKKEKKDAVLAKLKDSGYIDMYVMTYIYKKINHLAPKDKVRSGDVIGPYGRAGNSYVKSFQVFNLDGIIDSTIKNTYLSSEIEDELISASSNESRYIIISDYLKTDLSDREKRNAENYAESILSLISINDLLKLNEPDGTLDNDELFSKDEVISIISGISEKLDIEIKRTSSSPYYSPSRDHIGMPDVDNAKTPTGYLFSFLHELSHWTGHESRFKDYGRKEKISGNGFDGQGSSYALEELAVTISASNMIAKHTGYYVLAGMNESDPDLNITIPNDPMAYLKSWSSNNDEDRIKELSKAVSRGDYIAMNLNSEISNVFENEMKKRTTCCDLDDSALSPSESSIDISL